MDPHQPQNAPVIRRRKVATLRRRDGLLRYASNVTSQNGEDGILARIFDCIRNDATTRWCVDVGAWDGKHWSNTYSLLHNGGWSGVLIEADADKFRELSALYADRNNIVCLEQAVSVEGQGPCLFSNVLKSNGVPAEFDLLNIDIDGADYWVWHDLIKSGCFRPNVVCIEFNPTMPNDLVYIPPRSNSIRHGASLAALYELAEAHGYTLVETTLFNAFFVRDEVFKAYLTAEVKGTSIESLHETTMGTSLYQLYDGTLKLSGCK